MASITANKSKNLFARVGTETAWPRKYFRLFVSLFQTSLVADLEYRLNIIVKISTDIIWYICQLSVFEVLFRHTQNLAGWTVDSTRVFMGLLFVTDAVFMFLFSENLDRLSDRVRKGELDLILVKPIDSQFMISLQKMATPYLANIVISIGWLIFALWHYPQTVHWSRLGLLLILIPCSVAISYSIRFFFSACALIFTRAENINYLWYQIYRLGMRPDSIYPTWLRYGVLTFLPVAFLASVPTRLILQDESPWLLVGAILLSGIAIRLSAKFWRFALKFYASASS